MRLRPVEGPFALTARQDNSERLSCMNRAAEAQGLHRGMTLADARAYCPDLLTRPADPPAEARFLTGLRRWATRWCPWVGIDGADGLVLDITGSAHLWGGEGALLDALYQDCAGLGLEVRPGLADTRGAAWALARHTQGIAPPGRTRDALRPLPVEGLRLDTPTVIGLHRLGLRSIGALADMPRAPLARRFGAGLLMRLDQALGDQPEPVTPLADLPPLSVRLTLPDPIGLESDVMAGVERLLHALCDRLETRALGARVLRLVLRRVDRAAQEVELRLAAPLRDPARILPLFARGVSGVEAGFGIDQLRLEAALAEPLAPRQVTTSPRAGEGRLDDLITRIGARIGLENIQRFLPADSHIPERAFSLAPVVWSEPCGGFAAPRPRPLRMFRPEPVDGAGATPPARLRWRGQRFDVARATGPERLAPEWWLDDPDWRSGLRDYWQLETRQGRRLWAFFTPQNPGWFVQGEFA